MSREQLDIYPVPPGHTDPDETTEEEDLAARGPSPRRRQPTDPRVAGAPTRRSDRACDHLTCPGWRPRLPDETHDRPVRRSTDLEPARNGPRPDPCQQT
jgi:hypothetical protein